MSEVVAPAGMKHVGFFCDHTGHTPLCPYALPTFVLTAEPRVLEGDWETVRDALDALPMGAQIRWTTGDPIHVALAIHRGAHWDVTVHGGPLSSDNIARDETPIEVIA
ncbi:hypothetical protein [Rhodococcoides fascians]|uniref:hypothetical protein n=1 Tax=Rhodococcoides fascians TaxID=1828 RepID=UPI0012D2B981|nr:hypothetical protein [Rhodococcus fascians]